MLKRDEALVAIVVPLLAFLAFGFPRYARDVPAPRIGEQAPPFTLSSFEGRSIDLEGLRGKVVFLNFWASWCAPCRAEAGTLETAWRTYRDQGVVFVGVNIRDRIEDAHEFLREFGITYPNARDLSGRAVTDYGVWGLPQTFVIDRTGRITYKQQGSLSSSTVAARLDDALLGIMSPPGPLRVETEHRASG